MNKFKTLLTIIYLLLFGLVIISLYFFNHNDEKVIIFDVIQKSNNIGDDLGLLGEKKGVDTIKINKKVGKGFLLNENTFITSDHILKGNFNNYYLKSNLGIINLNDLEITKNKNIFILKLKNNSKTKALHINTKTNLGDIVYTIKDNKKIFGKILKTNVKLNEINLKGLIKTNINLIKGDSGSPLFNKQGELIGVFQAIDKNNNSYAQKIAN